MVGDPPPRPSKSSTKLPPKMPGMIRHPGEAGGESSFVNGAQFKNRKGPTTGSHKFKTEVRKKKTPVGKCKRYPDYPYQAVPVKCAA